MVLPPPSDEPMRPPSSRGSSTRRPLNNSSSTSYQQENNGHSHRRNPTTDSNFSLDSQLAHEVFDNEHRLDSPPHFGGPASTPSSILLETQSIEQGHFSSVERELSTSNIPGAVVPIEPLSIDSIRDQPQDAEQSPSTILSETLLEEQGSSRTDSMATSDRETTESSLHSPVHARSIGSAFFPIVQEDANHAYQISIPIETLSPPETVGSVASGPSRNSLENPSNSASTDTTHSSHHDRTAVDETDSKTLIHPWYKRWKCVVPLVLLTVAMLVVAAAVSSVGIGEKRSETSDRKERPSTPRPAPATAPPPSTYSPTQLWNNDICQQAYGPLTINGPPVVSSTLESLETNNVPTCGAVATNGLQGKWYHFTGGGEVIRANTCGGTTDFDTQVSIYRGDCSRLRCVAGNDQFCGDQSSVSWFAEKGVQYFVYVHGSSNGRGNFSLEVGNEKNGLCDQAIGPIENDGSATIGSLRGASLDELFSCDGVITRSGQVYYTVLGTGRWMVASTCHPLTEFRARIAVLEAGCSGCAAVRDSDCGNGFRAAWLSRANATYNVMVFKSTFSSGSVFGLDINEFSPVGNDECANAVDIEVGEKLVRGSTMEATLDAVSTCNVEALQPGVWFKVTGTGSKLLASTCNSATSFATKITIYTGSCDGPVCVASDDQFCGEKASVHWDSMAGKAYYILVHGSDYGVVPNVGEFGLTTEEFIPEENDECIDAIPVDPIGETLVGSTFAATYDDAPACDGVLSAAPGVWYTITPKVSELLLASTCDPATDFDTQISIYRGSCDGLKCIIMDDNSCGFQSSVAWSATAGVTYYIFVHGRLKSSMGNFVLAIKQYSPAISNDFCENAISTPVNGTVLFGSTSTATFDNVGNCGVPNTAPGVWYSVDGTGTEITASLCRDETDFDTAISVFSGECTSLQCITGNNNGVAAHCGRKSAVNWLSKIDETYYILVHGYSTRTGDFGLFIKENEPVVNNDFCVLAESVSIDASTIAASTVGAKVDDVPDCFGIPSDGPGIWYQVTGTGDQLVASTCDSDSKMDTRISVFQGVCSNLTCVFAADSSCDLQSRVIWATEVGETYYILVHGPADQTGDFGLTVEKFVSQQANDKCPQAILVPPNGSVYIGSTVGSSYDNVGFCGTYNTGLGVWFLVVGTGERITADTCDVATNFDTRIGVFMGSCDRLLCVDGNDDGCGLKSSISWNTQVGQLYWVLVHGWGTTSGRYGLKVSGSNILGGNGF